MYTSQIDSIPLLILGCGIMTVLLFYTVSGLVATVGNISTTYLLAAIPLRIMNCLEIHYSPSHLFLALIRFNF